MSIRGNISGKIRSLSLRDIALFSLLGALMFVLKMALAFLPNVEPVTLMVILLAVCFGWKGLISVFVYIACEYMIWGIGLWSISYLYVWPLLFGVAMMFRGWKSPLFWAFLSAVFGFSFGALCSLPMLLTGGWSAAFVWWQSGVFFDLIHGIANFLVALLLFSPLRNLLQMLAERRSQS